MSLPRRLGVAGLVVLVAFVAMVIIPNAPRISWANYVAWTVGPIAFTAIGVAILFRIPRNFVGVSLVLIGVAAALEGLAFTWLLEQPADPATIDYVALLVANMMFLVTLFVPVHLFYVFPTGRLMSRRWLWEPVLLGLLVFLVLIGGIFAPELTHPEAGWTLTNPIGVDWGFSDSGGTGESAFLSAMAFLMLGGVVALVLRYLRSGPVVRAQIRWVVYAAALYGVAGVVSLEDLTDVPAAVAVDGALTVVSYVGLIAAIGVAVTRYRLFEIDRLISRTVGYLMVVGSLGVVYFGALYLLGLMLPFDSSFGVAASTLAAVSLFNPARRRILQFVDRRFDRSRYDAVSVVRAFMGRLGGPMDESRLTHELEGVLDVTMRPESVGVWLRMEP